MLQTSATEKTLSDALMVGAPLVTIAVVASTLTDPVNVPKFLILGILAVGTFFVLLSRGIKQLWFDAKIPLTLGVVFLLCAIGSVVQSGSPIQQNLYGSYGRNTGFLTYLFLSLIFLVTSTLRNLKSFQKVLVGFGAAGFINVVYALWAWQIGDFIPWNNPYNTILGTLGNPNFIGAFLGIFVSVAASFAVKPNLKFRYRVVFFAVIAIALLEIRKSHAVQGVVVSGAGFAIVIFFYLRSRYKSLLAISAYLLSITVVGVYALLGALQIGPLTQYIYKSSVSLRGEYWQAGWNMGIKFPFSGVGMDSYGDWYRRMRDDHALIVPGPNTVTNAAHNIPIDLLSYGGWPLFISYIAIFVAALVCAVKIFVRQRDYDAVFVAIFVGWTGYQLQSIISINQIGLAIWGWIFSGALIAYESTTRPNLPIVGNRYSKQNSVISPQLILGIGMVIGLFIALPPFNGDAKWRSALMSGNSQKVEEALISRYLQPADSYRYATAIQLFESNKLYDQAYKYAKIALDYNPNSFDAWRMFYYLTRSTEADKTSALNNLKRLDPLNPDVLKLPSQ